MLSANAHYQLSELPKAKARLAIVEDEAIVAMDIESRLKHLGYQVVGAVSTGEEALTLVEREKPDLVLMDIMLGGALDGIQAAAEIRERHNLPVIYLTAYADEHTIDRAKITSPFGYLTKPFEDRELAITLEMALYKNTLDRQLQEQDHRLATTLNSLGEAVLATDPSGLVSYLNPMAQTMMQLTPGEAVGKRLTDVFRLRSAEESDINTTINLANRVETAERSMTYNGIYSLVLADNISIPVNLTVSPISNGRGSCTGHVLVFRDISEQLASKQELERSLKRLNTTLAETVNALGVTSEKRDPYTAGHQHRVAQLACAVAKVMGMEEDRVQGIRVAALLHDLGKLQIPAEILSKPTRLTDLEMAMMKTHSEGGFDILKSIPFPWPVATIVHQHHERLDGNGYPNGLSGDDILLEARIISVADVVEAMSSHRPYRPALGEDAALSEVQKGRGTRYDPDVVDACQTVFQQGGFSFSYD